MDNVPKITYYVVSDLLQVKVTEAKKMTNVYLIFLYAATLLYK